MPLFPGEHVVHEIALLYSPDLPVQAPYSAPRNVHIRPTTALSAQPPTLPITNSSSSFPPSLYENPVLPFPRHLQHHDVSIIHTKFDFQSTGSASTPIIE